MAAFTHTPVTLTANQAAGTDPVRAAGSNNVNSVLILANPGGNAMLLQSGPGGTPGFGLPIPPAGHIAFGKDWPDWDNAIYVIGTTGDKLSIFEG